MIDRLLCCNGAVVKRPAIVVSRQTFRPEGLEPHRHERRARLFQPERIYDGPLESGIRLVRIIMFGGAGFEPAEGKKIRSRHGSQFLTGLLPRRHGKHLPPPVIVKVFELMDAFFK